MLHRTIMVFDDNIPPGETAWTDIRHDVLLGEHSELGLHAVFDNASAAGTCAIYLLHSGDGSHWLFRGSNSPVVPPSTPEILLTLKGVGDLQHGYWSDACLGVSQGDGPGLRGPLLSFVRLAIVLSHGDRHRPEPALAGHLKIHATQRGSRL